MEFIDFCERFSRVYDDIVCYTLFFIERVFEVFVFMGCGFREDFKDDFWGFSDVGFILWFVTDDKVVWFYYGMIIYLSIYRE